MLARKPHLIHGRSPLIPVWLSAFLFLAWQHVLSWVALSKQLLCVDPTQNRSYIALLCPPVWPSDPWKLLSQWPCVCSQAQIGKIVQVCSANNAYNKHAKMCLETSCYPLKQRYCYPLKQSQRGRQEIALAIQVAGRKDERKYCDEHFLITLALSFHHFVAQVKSLSFHSIETWCCSWGKLCQTISPMLFVARVDWSIDEHA